MEEGSRHALPECPMLNAPRPGSREIRRAERPEHFLTRSKGAETK